MRLTAVGLVLIILGGCGGQTVPAGSPTTNEARDACEPLLKRELARPASAEFHLFSYVVKYEGSRTTFGVRITARNGFGAEAKLIGMCTFQGMTVTETGVFSDPG